MAATEKVTLTISELGKWGPKVGNEYLSWSKNIKDSDKGKVVKGGTYLLDLYIADSGKRYINSVSAVEKMTEANTEDKSLLPETIARRALFGTSGVKPKATTSGSETMSKDEWASKDRRISRQGCIQVAVQVESDFEKAISLANKMLEFVNG